MVVEEHNYILIRQIAHCSRLTGLGGRNRKCAEAFVTQKKVRMLRRTSNSSDLVIAFRAAGERNVEWAKSVVILGGLPR